MTKTVFVSGQSNSLGRDTGGPAWASITGVRVWDNANPLGANGSAFRTPVNTRAIYGTFEFTDRNNAAVWFCRRLAQYLSETIDMTIVARGGTAISGWAPGDSVGMLQECLDVWAATGQGPADIFVWHNNESNSGTSATGYRDAWLALAANLEAGGVIGPNTKILLVGTPEDNAARVAANRNSLGAIVAADPRCTITLSDGLSTYDGLHFTGDALYVLGAHRIFDAYMKAEASMVATYAYVNEGGVPGEPGTGTPKIVNLESLLTQGYRPKGPPIYMTANQIYNRPADVVALDAQVQAAGGGGSGALGTDGVARIGGGGGGGGYCRALIANPEASYMVTVGTGGLGGAAGQNNGSVGSASSFGHLSANPGGAGTTFGSTSDVVVASSGSGGSSTTGDFNARGNPGGRGIKLTASVRIAGDGGNAMLGTGGNATNASSTAGNSNGQAGTGYGSGGGGGLSSTSANAAGGDGAPGVVIVQEYIRG